MRRTVSLSVGCLLAASLSAQPNVIPGLDVKTSDANNLSVQGRSGSFPNGFNGLAMLTQSCNVGSVPIEWFAPMDERHPFITMLVAREHDGRFEQISTRGYVKHGFLSINASRCGFVCQNPGTGTLLGIRCSDTYGSSLNGDRYWLGPHEEIDPWLGTWTARGSYFDRGDPDVGPPRNSDGIRSLSRSQAGAMPPLKNRMTVSDQDLQASGARYFYQGYYVALGESEVVRTNNMYHRETNPNWNGSSWSFPNMGDPDKGSVLKRWTGAFRSSNTNGSDDGRFFVAVKTTGPDSNGMYTYTYAVHNRDNSRGAAALRIPICPDASAGSSYFHDDDYDSNNDWGMQRASNEVAFLAGVDNALVWNSIFTFEFQSNAEPVLGEVTLDQAMPGPGAPTVTVVSMVPGTNLNLGAGCGVPSAPVLATTGTPPQATIPNATFGLEVTGLGAGANTAIFVGLGDANIPIGGCSIYIAQNLPFWASAAGTADANGVFASSLPVPNDTALEGATLTFQASEQQAGGALGGQLDLSNGLKVIIGNNCP